MRRKVLVDEPHLQSQASLILLKRSLIPNCEYRGWAGWLRFRLETLTCWLAERGVLRCEYCGHGPLLIEACSDRLIATLDHYVPTSRGGGRFDLDNLRVACFACNQRKKDLRPEEWKVVPSSGIAPDPTPPKGVRSLMAYEG